MSSKRQRSLTAFVLVRAKAFWLLHKISYVNYVVKLCCHWDSLCLGLDDGNNDGAQ